MTAASVRLPHHTYRLWADGIPRAEVRDDVMHELVRSGLSPGEKTWVLDALVTEGITSRERRPPGLSTQPGCWRGSIGRFSMHSIALMPGISL
jgi:hypothetical protein